MGFKVMFATLLAGAHERLFQFLKPSASSTDNGSAPRCSPQRARRWDTEGLDKVVTLLRREVGRQQASLLIVDGLLKTRSPGDTGIDTKRFIAKLEAHAAVAGCAVLFLTTVRRVEGSAEHTMVDGVIELCAGLVGSRSLRRIQVRKCRDSGALTGPHEFEIASHGGDDASRQKRPLLLDVPALVGRVPSGIAPSTR